MIDELYIENFVLIEKAELTLPKGLIAITGETGAGKSLFVQCIKSLLGGKFNHTLIRENQEKAIIQATISIDYPHDSLLQDLNITPENNQIIVRRMVTKSGRIRNTVSGVQVTSSELKLILEDIISLAGQHEGQKLLREDAHLQFLDQYANIVDKLEEYKRFYHRWLDMRNKFQERVKKNAELQSMLEKLREEALKVDKIAPKEDEDIKLEEEIKLLKSVNQILNLGNECYRLLYEQKGSVIEILHKVALNLQKMANIDASFEKIIKYLDDASSIITEASHSIKEYLDRLPTDISQLEKKEDRYYQLKELKRYFSLGLNEIIIRRRQIDKELEQLKKNEFIIEELENELKGIENNMVYIAKIISDIRKSSAKYFAEEIENSLAELKMKGTRFQVEVISPDEPNINHVTSTGLDRVTFLFSPNPGMPLKPLKETASGGELSRVLLAIKEVLTHQQENSTIIFDEIDAGLSAEVSELVGLKLKKLSKKMQVIVITHSPQIAALADCHIVAKKFIENDTTTTKLYEVSGEERIQELCRMLGGISEETRNLAIKFLEKANNGNLYC